MPLYYDRTPGMEAAADPGEYARRLRLFCESYGLSESGRGQLLDVVQARQQVMYDTVRIWGEAGIPGFAEMWQSGHGEANLRDRSFVEAFRQILGSKL